MKSPFMDLPVASHGGHSAQVEMRLLLNGYGLAVSQMGSDFILVSDPVDHAPTQATLILKVDAVERQWNVVLPDGISSSSKRVAIAPATSKISSLGHTVLVSSKSGGITD